MNFEGFSDSDILKLSQEKSATKDGTNTKKVATKHKKVSFKVNRNHHDVNQTTLNKKIILEESLPEAAKLQVQNPVCKQENTEETRQQNGNVAVKPHENKTTNQKIEGTEKCKDLHELQTRQKLMEEQNRKRKELLSKALADRTKRTQEEAQRLNEIQNEFKKLDATLSSDVKILRKQIDLASVDYMEAQKRYLKIEREFLDAKLHLQQKLEKKEMLTEHLYAIIEKNEERKAKALTELLEKLKLDPKEIEDTTAIQINEVSSSEAIK